MGPAFVITILAILFAVTTVFMDLYPRVLISSLNPNWSLTVYNAASNPYTLKIMLVVALIFVPIVLVYQGWSYWVYRGRITKKENLEY
jgi:cytochrome d ubiquinol oxidase subunit II